jgi:hypothetical protein
MTENQIGNERQRQPSVFHNMNMKNAKTEKEQFGGPDVIDADAGFNAAIELDDFDTTKHLAGWFVRCIRNDIYRNIAGMRTRHRFPSTFANKSLSNE